MTRTQSKRVLMLIENHPYPQDTRVRAEAEALRDAGYAVTVISPGRKNQKWREVVDGVVAYRFPEPREGHGFVGYLWEYGYSTVAMFLLSLAVWLREGFHVIHAANPPDTLVLIGAFHKFFGKRFVYDDHDLSPELYHANFRGKGETRAYRALLLFERLSCKAADHIIATNESYRETVIQRCGVPADRITIVRNGPNFERFRAAVADPSLRKPGKVMIGYVGDMGVHDGLDYLLRSLSHLLNDLGRTDFHCLCVGGRGQMLERLRRLTEQLGLCEYVTFTGWIPERDKLRYLASADICVDPDPLNPFNDKSTMTKIAEYMALGKPIVAFDLRENRFTAQAAAFFVPGNDEVQFAGALSQLMDDKERRAVMGTFGRRRVESRLDWRHSVPHLLSAYRQLFDSSSPERVAQPAGGDDIPQNARFDKATGQ
jgi:glycosyltransferase involved in cell wall biosynthesis